MSEKEITREEIQKTRPSVDLFPQMMSNTRMLIIDYDVTRVHSFDIFRMLLLDDSLVYNIDPNLYPILTAESFEEQLGYYIQFTSSLCPYDLFTNTKDKLKLADYEKLIPDLINNELIRITPTDIMDQFSVVFARNNITGYLLRYDSDKTEIPWENQVKTFTSKSILDMRMASAIIEKYHINAVMCSSIEASIILCQRLDSIQYREPITFIIGRYGYNCDPNHLGLMRLTDYMYYYTMKYKYEFGTFAPFTNLQLPNRKEENLDD